MGFEVLDISGDIGLKAYGASCEEAFVSAGIGMYSLMTDTGQVEEKASIEVNVKDDSLEGLLVNYLNELVFQFDANNFIGKSIEIISSELQTQNSELRTQNCALKARIHGEEFDPGRHERRLLIKAATYHKIKVEENDDKWEINVIFDI